MIKNADMSEDMQQDAVDCATQAMEKYNIEKDIAAYIKKVRQDGCMDGSKWSSVSLHHWHMICKFRAFLFSVLFLVSVETGFYNQGCGQDLFFTEVISPQVPPKHTVFNMFYVSSTKMCISICFFFQDFHILH